jgi:hypothetical protein
MHIYICICTYICIYTDININIWIQSGYLHILTNEFLYTYYIHILVYISVMDITAERAITLHRVNEMESTLAEKINQLKIVEVIIYMHI